MFLKFGMKYVKQPNYLLAKSFEWMETKKLKPTRKDLKGSSGFWKVIV